MGPSMRATTVLAASGNADPIDDANWIYRRLPWPAVISVAQIATTDDVLVSFTIGSDLQLQESPVPAGGTAGQFPTEDAQFDEYVGAAGDLLTLSIRETAGAAATVMTVIRLTPQI